MPPQPMAGGPLPAGASPVVRRLSTAHAGPSTRPCARGLSFRASSSSSGDASSSSAAAVAEVLRQDLSYLDSHTGLDLNGKIGAVKDAHDEVVAALNPPAGEAMALELEEQIAGLQQDLAVANQQVGGGWRGWRTVLIGRTQREGHMEQGACRWCGPASAATLPSSSLSLPLTFLSAPPSPAAAAAEQRASARRDGHLADRDAAGHGAPRRLLRRP